MAYSTPVRILSDDDPGYGVPVRIIDGSPSPSPTPDPDPTPEPSPTPDPDHYVLKSTANVSIAPISSINVTATVVQEA